MPDEPLQLAEGFLHSVFPCNKGKFGKVLAQSATTVGDLQRLEPDTPVVDDWVTRGGLAPDTPIYAAIWSGDCTWEDDDGFVSQLVEARVVFFADGNGIITQGADAEEMFQQDEHAFDPTFPD